MIAFMPIWASGSSDIQQLIRKPIASGKISIEKTIKFESHRNANKMKKEISRNRGPSKPRVQSLARADSILGAVMDNDGPISLSALSDTLGLNKTTVFNLAESLIVLGYLQRSKFPKGYKLGLRCLELGLHLFNTLPILGVSRPAMQALSLSTKEMVNLAIPSFNDAILIEVLQSPQGVRATAHAGSLSAYHSSACGKALFAHFPEERRKWIYDNVGMNRITEFTITDRNILEAQIRDIQSNGFATEEQENELGASCVAAPIFGPFGEVVAAISITGVLHRMSQDRIEALAKELIVHTKSISQQLQRG